MFPVSLFVCVASHYHPTIDNAAHFVQNKSAANYGAEAYGMNVEENIKRGRRAIEEMLQPHGEVKGAMASFSMDFSPLDCKSKTQIVLAKRKAALIQ